MLSLVALRALPWKLIGVCALGLAFFALVAALKIERAHSAKLSAQIVACSEARKADRSAYEKAQAEAQAKNRAHVETENKLREQINEKSRTGFIADRDRLRAQANGAAKGAAGSTGVSGVSKGAGGTAPEAVPLPSADLLRAQETELQLNALIDWVLGQSAVKSEKIRGVTAGERMCNLTTTHGYFCSTSSGSLPPPTSGKCMTSTSRSTS